jgi:hypothetical protein
MFNLEGRSYINLSCDHGQKEDGGVKVVKMQIKKLIEEE